MTPQDKPKFLATLAGLAAVKPGKGLTPEALEIWWISLADWPLAEFQRAASHLAKSVEFMPSPYHFEQLRKSAALEAGAEAWAQVVNANRGNDWRMVSARAQRVVQAMGGRQALAMMQTSELPFREKRFRELWEEIGETDTAREALPELAASRDARLSSALTGLITQIRETPK